MAYSAESMYGMTVEAAQEVSQQQIQSYDDRTQEKLQEMINQKEQRGGTKKKVSPRIATIHKESVRVVTNRTAKKKEFNYSNGRPVPKGFKYHTHYTKNFEEYNMTGGKHKPSSKLIWRSKPTSFSLYKGLKGNVAPLKLESEITKPTRKDRTRGFMFRYFAKKTNEESGPIEISEQDYNTSSLYDYERISWHIKGTPNYVNELNQLSVARAEINVPGINKLLPALQYFEGTRTTVPLKQAIQETLGITEPQDYSEPVVEEENTQTAPSGYNAGSGGPPPGFGGAY